MAKPEAAAMISVGDDGALDVELNSSLSEIWIDRDLGWLDFNERVLAEALDDRTPLLERAKFLAIFTSNLDEFFMKRVAVLRRAEGPDAARLREQIRNKVIPMLRAQAEYFRNRLVPELAQHAIYLRHWHELTTLQKEEANNSFDTQISAAVTPLIISLAQPFPFLSNLSTSLVFSVDDPVSARHVFGRIKVPANLHQWVQLHSEVGDSEILLVRLHEIIRANLHKLYRGMKLGPVSLVRLSREMEVEDESEQELSLLEQVRQAIRRRRFQPVVRLEFAEGSDPAARALLREHFRLHDQDIYEFSDELDYTSLFEIANLNVCALKDKPWVPVIPPALSNKRQSIFNVMREGDVLVHHPYESFDASVEHFIEAASRDQQTIAIKMTVYRVGDDTPFVKSLIKAAEAGKQVACVIELHARLDEERNLHWASELEKAGAHVDFGVVGLKIHAKTALVVRKESEGIRTYVHIGTGNYHVRTARLYSDVGLLTCDPKITDDVVWLFHYLTGRSDRPDCKTLLVAPTTMRTRFLELVNREIDIARSGRPGRIIAKMNQLEDPQMIQALCDASRAGVSIDLIIRGFCCLKPGVAGQTENIRVRSIIGRFLEHSRIYYFGAGAVNPLDGEFYIGSADWMFRNLSRRIEVITPVLASGPRARLWEILEINLQDRVQGWLLDSKGTYSRPGQPGSTDADFAGTHRELMEIALHEG
ncbi:MAG: polyphosphate kinase 1 [Acidobacteriaceae bacterium]|nr:polyphosphate kinase 1 [Acidobacteriaceae bacterium]